MEGAATAGSIGRDSSISSLVPSPSCIISTSSCGLSDCSMDLRESCILRLMAASSVLRSLSCSSFFQEPFSPSCNTGISLAIFSVSVRNFSISSRSESLGRPNNSALSVLANSTNLTMNSSCSGVGGMLCIISFFFGAVYADVLCRPVISDLSVVRCQLRHFDKIAETPFLHDFVSDGKLIVHRLLGEDWSPRVKGLDVLCCEGLGTQILEQQVQLRK